MGRIESYAPGSFCWAELATSDAASARTFYSDMFGWTVQENPFPGGVYLIFQSEGNDAAAAYGAREGVPPHWNLYFSTADVDASAALVEPAGGKILQAPFDVMDKGRMAAVQDPHGANFCLWQSRQHVGATHSGPLNQACWAELASPDPAGSAAFYGRIFGWKTKPATGLQSAEYVEWINGANPAGGMIPMRGDMWKGVPPHWMVYFSVADCDERAARARQLGANVCVPPTDIPEVGRFSVLTDFQGAVFSIIRLTGMQQPASA